MNIVCNIIYLSLFWAFSSDVWINIIKCFFLQTVATSSKSNKTARWPLTTGGRWWRWPDAPQLQVTAAWWKPHCWLILQLELELENPYTYIWQGEIMILDIDNWCLMVGAMVMTTNSWACDRKKWIEAKVDTSNMQSNARTTSPHIHQCKDSL